MIVDRSKDYKCERTANAVNLLYYNNNITNKCSFFFQITLIFVCCNFMPFTKFEYLYIFFTIFYSILYLSLKKYHIKNIKKSQNAKRKFFYVPDGCVKNSRIIKQSPIIDKTKCNDCVRENARINTTKYGSFASVNTQNCWPCEAIVWDIHIKAWRDSAF